MTQAEWDQFLVKRIEQIQQVRPQSVRPSGRRTFSAGLSNRLTQDWPTTGLSIDSVLSGQGATLQARARYLARENEYFQKFLTMLVGNVIGEKGMTLKNKATEPPQFKDKRIVPGELDALANDLIEMAWWEWGKKENCTVNKNLTWLQVQRLAVEEFGTAGETLWMMVTGPAARNRFNFALKPIKIERLHWSSNYNLGNGNKVRNGVETNPDGMVVAYWLTDGDPTDTLYSLANSYEPRRYSAEMFVHPFMLREIDQRRGFPWAAASMLRMKMLAGYDEATLVGARAAASKMAFLTKTPGAGSGYEGENAADGGKYMDAEPGLLEELPLGMDVKVVDWNQPNGNYDPFVKACLRGIASGLNVSYPTLANDYESVNFSSGRMARLEEVEFWKLCQSAIATDFHEPVFAKWLEYALLAQAIKIQLNSGREIILPASRFEKFNQPCFHGRRWGWVDPTKEVAAKAEEIRLGITSWTRILSELGIDRDELFDEIKQDRDAAKSRGITLPDEAAAEMQPDPTTEDADTPEDKEEPEEDTKDEPERNGRFHLNGTH